MSLQPDEIIIDCSDCRREIGEFEDVFFMFGKPVCSDCRPCCSLCGEWMDDSIKPQLPIVRYRDPLDSGKLTVGDHANCAADWIISLMAKDAGFVDKAGIVGADDFTREQIAEMVRQEAVAA